MDLPDVFLEKVKPDHQLTGLISTAISQFSGWLEMSSTPFFPEYTDHSLKHVEEVLGTSVDIASNEAIDILSGQDVTAFTLAVCLHDCAMHLTEDGFLSLVSKNSLWKPVEFFDSKSWQELWEDFISEARRFDGRKLKSLFGDTNPIQRPPENHLDWTNRDRLLIGEFIRRHHARLAHEIALYGVPAQDGQAYSIVDAEKYPEIADLAGVIARSHGLPLRDSVEYVNENYHLRTFDGIHTVYLMVLLRIADYLQIQSGRAPSEVLELKSLQIGRAHV